MPDNNVTVRLPRRTWQCVGAVLLAAARQQTYSDDPDQLAADQTLLWAAMDVIHAACVAALREEEGLPAQAQEARDG